MHCPCLFSFSTSCIIGHLLCSLDCSRTRNGTRAEVHRPDPRKDEAFVSLLNGDIIISWKVFTLSYSQRFCLFTPHLRLYFTFLLYFAPCISSDCQANIIS
jgi:hypothetical protein